MLAIAIGGKVSQDWHTFAISTILNIYLLLANKLEQVWILCVLSPWWKYTCLTEEICSQNGKKDIHFLNLLPKSMTHYLGFTVVLQH